VRASESAVIEIADCLSLKVGMLLLQQRIKGRKHPTPMYLVSEALRLPRREINDTKWLLHGYQACSHSPNFPSASQKAGDLH